MKIGKLELKNGQLIESNCREIQQSQLSSECWNVQIYGLSHCDQCEYRDTEDCGGENIRRTGKNAMGHSVPL